MDRIEKLEKISARLARRSVKVSTGLITPYPISVAKTGDNIQGDLLHYMFPCAGTIVKGAIRFDNKPKGSVVVGIKLFNNNTTYTDEFNVENKLTVVEPNLKILSFDCLDISIHADPEYPVTRVWISLLWIPHVKEVTAMSFLIDELDRVAKGML